MKRATLVRLARLMQAKAQLETAALAGDRRAQEAALQESETLAQSARTAAAPEGPASPADLRNAAGFVAGRHAAARAKRDEADRMAAALAEKRESVRAAVGSELVSATLLQDATKKARKVRLDGEESAREELVSAKRTRATGNKARACGAMVNAISKVSREAFQRRAARAAKKTGSTQG